MRPILMILLCIPAMLGCSKRSGSGASGDEGENPGPGSLPRLTVEVTPPPGMTIGQVGLLTVTATVEGGKTFSKNTEGAAPVIFELPEGNYLVEAQSNVSASVSIAGSATVELQSDRLLQLPLETTLHSTLLIQSIYYAGNDGYTADSYLTIVNNSENEQYLDGVIIASMPPSGLPAAIEGHYLVRGCVVAFPGDGFHNRMLPGQMVTIARNAADHSALKDGRSPDLSRTEWEVYCGDTGDTDYPTPNMSIIFNSSGDDDFFQGSQGMGLILARLEKSANPAEYASNPTNHLAGGLKIPLGSILDAVEVTSGAGCLLYGNFLSRDEAGYAYSTPGSGLCVRRKATEQVAMPQFYRDNNNSSADFLSDQPL